MQASGGCFPKMYRCQEAAVVKERAVQSSKHSPSWVLRKAIAVSKAEVYRLLGRCSEDFSPAALLGPAFGSECRSNPSTDTKTWGSQFKMFSPNTSTSQGKVFLPATPHVPQPSSNLCCSSFPPRNSAEAEGDIRLREGPSSTELRKRRRMLGDVFNNGDPYEHLPHSGCFSENPSPVLGKGWEGSQPPL